MRKNRPRVKDEIDLTKLIWTNAEFSSNAMVVLDKIAGWDEEGRFDGKDRYDGSHTGGRLAARIWIYSKVLLCNGRRSNLRDQKRDAVVEAINWAWRDAEDNHDWVS